MPVNNKSHLDYSPGGKLNRITDTEGNMTDYLYDPVGRLAGIWAQNWQLSADSDQHSAYE